MNIKKQRRTHGGRREGSGRKPVADKKIQMYVFIESSVVEKLGRESVQTALNATANRLRNQVKTNKLKEIVGAIKD